MHLPTRRRQVGSWVVFRFVRELLSMFLYYIDPPENITISHPEVTVVEGAVLEHKIHCSATAFPGIP